jgi:hypothetical protein
MDHVKPVKRVCHGVGLVKFEGVMLLRLDVHADHIKPCAVVAHCCAACTAKEVEESWFMCHFGLNEAG